eukprot:TRINITY_DN93877_c0_g1_i1.p1 TRINITY_DN93877_c0_g1~~TRINITY_DN93877_c0_g1_i1.p1  ORF type:complete len:438 (+),score=59.91 TRINITY_DN93877_c0_g1_i1:69-1382(+)
MIHNAGLRWFVATSVSINFPDKFEAKTTVPCRADLPELHQDSQSYFQELRDLSLCGCGEVCKVHHGRPGRLFERVKRRVDCPALLQNGIVDSQSNRLPPPAEVPKALLDDFTMNSTIQIQKWYWDSTSMSSMDFVRDEQMKTMWSYENIERLADAVRSGSFDERIGSTWLGFSYSYALTFRIHSLLKRHADFLAGRHCLVLGSERPWLEALLLGHGAAKITVVEYRRLATDHPKISTLTPPELWSRTKNSDLFDCVASFSSIEHSGLGRYGDVVNPWGDLQTMAKLWCVSTLAAAFFIGIPVEDDVLVWNSHRLYGPRRLAQLFANIAVVEGVYGAGLPGGMPDLMFFGVRDSDVGTNSSKVVKALAHARRSKNQFGNPECWQDDFTFEICCPGAATGTHGHGGGGGAGGDRGNPRCWQGPYSMDFCCNPPQWLLYF